MKGGVACMLVAPETLAELARRHFDEGGPVDAIGLMRDADKVGGNVKKEVEEHLRKISQVDPWLAAHPPRMEWILDADCAEVAIDHPIIRTFRDASQAVGHPLELWGMGAHTDMGIPTELAGTPTVNFGPGDPSQAYQPNESVTLDEL